MFKSKKVDKYIPLKTWYKRTTYHAHERNDRYNTFREHGVLSGKIVGVFEVDKGHVDGVEIHAINDKGICFIYNKRKERFITLLALRERQFDRYFEGGKAPLELDYVKERIKRNIEEGLNYV